MASRTDRDRVVSARRTDMRTMLIILTTVLVAGCGSDERVENGNTAAGRPAQAVEAVEPMLVDGVQVVEIEASASGYIPSRVAVEAGIPVRLIFTRTADAACIESVRVPEYDVEKTELPMGEPKPIEFTPDESGEFTFVCGMGMQKGTLVVSS